MSHEEELFGKTYDSRLMSRLLAYLWPYWRLALTAVVVIVANAMLQLTQPYLTKLVIDRYIAQGDLGGIGRIAILFLFVLTGGFALEFAETWLMQMLGQRVMFDLRTEI